jgi:hypothetical protein
VLLFSANIYVLIGTMQYNVLYNSQEIPHKHILVHI